MPQQPVFDFWQAVATILPALGLGAMVGGIVVAFIKRGTDKEANDISEKDVNTRAATMGLEVLREGLAELRTELKEERDKGRERDGIMGAQALQIEAQTVKLSQQHEEIENLKSKVEALHVQRDILIEHVTALEQGYPVPPGPPKRPNWGAASLA